MADTAQLARFGLPRDEEARSRIYAGIHFTFNHTVGFGVCTAVANYVADNYLRPLGTP